MLRRNPDGSRRIGRKREQLLELVDDEEQPARISGGRPGERARDVRHLGPRRRALRVRDDCVQRPQQRFRRTAARQHDRDAPCLVAGGRRSEQRQQPGPDDAGLPAPAGSDEQQQTARPRHRLEALDQPLREQLTPEEVTRVRLAERPQALVRVPRAGGGPRNIERRVLAQDRQLERLELGGWVDAQLIGKQASTILVDAQRVRLAAGAVQGAHELRPQVLTQRLLGHEGLKLARDVATATEREVRLETVLECTQPQLVEAGDLRLQERFVREVLEGLAAPQGQGVAKPRCGLGGFVGEQLVTLPRQALEPGRVDRVGLDPQGVAAGLGRDRAPAVGGPGIVAWPGFQRRPEPRHMERDAASAALRRRIAPQRVEDVLGRDGPTGMDEQECEQGTLTPGRDRADPTPLDDLEGAEDPDLHRAPLLRDPATFVAEPRTAVAAWLRPSGLSGGPVGRAPPPHPGEAAFPTRLSGQTPARSCRTR